MSATNPSMGPTPEHRGIRDRVIELIRVRADELAPNPANWRRHPEHQRAALRGLLAEIGYADALLARRDGEQLVLVDGHLRQSLDPDQVVPVLVLDVTEAEAETLLATVDPLAALAQPDPGALASLLGRVETADLAVRELLERIAREAKIGLILPTDLDALPPEPPARTRPGDLWAAGAHRLLCGNATNPAAVERLMAGERADVLWTDPPYGVDYVGKTARALRVANDGASELSALLRTAFAAVGPGLEAGAAIYICHQSGPGAIEVLEAFRNAG